MRARLLGLFFIIILSGCSEKTSINDQVIGIWKAVLDEEQLLKFGMTKEEINRSAAEMKFSKTGQLEVRVICEKDCKGRNINILLGVYKIENKRLKMSFKEGVWEDQKITIASNKMSLEPKEYNGDIVNRFIRIDEWSLRLE